MSAAKIVVIDGPDQGKEYAIPLRGGSIGRDADSAVHLSDPAISRNHCAIELRRGRLALVDRGSRNQTLVNGAPITVHPLEDGDKIIVGKTVLQFSVVAPLDGTETATVGRPTMEITSRRVLATGSRAATSTEIGQLRAIATLGRTLSEGTDRGRLLDIVCDQLRDAMGAKCTTVYLRKGGGRLEATASSDPVSGAATLPNDLIGKVLGEGKSVAYDDVQGADGPLTVAAAPLWSNHGTPCGILWLDRERGRSWAESDILAIGCHAHLVSAAIVVADTHAALTSENADLIARSGGRSLIGSSPRAQEVSDFVAKVGPSDATILLTGESGSGKEMVSRAIHAASRRSDRAFIAINCAALTESLIESELFGHEKGAFTGASERKIGRFELADQGTLFLDEVGELPLTCQTKFLRVLEEQVFERVGGGTSISVDVRVVAATNRDLEAMVGAGSFREDLYYRLSVIHTEIPPLRQRREDIPDLAEHFLDRLKHQVPRRIRGIAPDAMTVLEEHDWPGNVRELRNAIERAIVLGASDHIQHEDLPPTMSRANTVATARDPAAAKPRSLKAVERDAIAIALAATAGNKAKAAQLLEIDRSTLYKKLKDYNLM